MRTAVTVVAIAILASPGSARADISCSKLSRAVMDPKIKSFLVRPETFLELYPRGDQGGKRELEINIRELVASDMKGTLASVIKLVPQSNVFQKLAIGAGLGAAAKFCEQAARPIDARNLMYTVRLTRDRTTLTAFMVGYIDPLGHPDLGSEPYVRLTNPLGRQSVASPRSDVFRDERLRDPFALSDPFAPLR